LKKVTNSAISAELRGFGLRNHTSGYKDYPFLAGDIITLVLVIALVIFSGIFL
jgi:energy-coupling factor transporter transmembrane protein EcfT